ncbi:hypothetical protein HPB50_014770 [Hyalomma asiaticum]|uniref:Uncharacterized protein n=1 Tax=Hyalomma asiaticum TaxID=266040 RepID=A0ACB7TI54_HYAAI|nr:hypothetical protein HPB50_014770 [Hyalomma asiaticum]
MGATLFNEASDELFFLTWLPAVPRAVTYEMARTDYRHYRLSWRLLEMRQFYGSSGAIVSQISLQRQRWTRNRHYGKRPFCCNVLGSRDAVFLARCAQSRHGRQTRQRQDEGKGIVTPRRWPSWSVTSQAPSTYWSSDVDSRYVGNCRMSRYESTSVPSDS